jgi:hypothetical protein
MKYSCEHGNETSGTLQDVELLFRLSDNFTRSTLGR